MVRIVKMDTRWEPNDGREYKFRGSFWYEEETELGPKRFDVPLDEIRLIEQGMVHPKHDGNSNKSNGEYKKLDMNEVLKIAENRGADFVRLSNFDSLTYLLYKHMPELSSRFRKKEVTKPGSVTRFKLSEDGNKLLPIKSKKVRSLQVSQLTYLCSLSPFDEDGNKLGIDKVKEKAFQLNGNVLVGEYQLVGKENPWHVYQNVVFK
jgi:hypothetical protein